MKRRHVYAVIVAVAVGLFVWFQPDTQPRNIGAPNDTALNAPQGKKTRVSSPHRLPSLVEKTGALKNDVRLRSLRSSGCWASCGAPCADISPEGFAICPEICQEDEDCSANARCLPTATTDLDVHRTRRCQESHCDKHSDCPNGKSCVQPIGANVTIGLCMLSGTRTEGQVCFHDQYKDESGRCAPGLLCDRGNCISLKTCDSNADCVLGTMCMASQEGNICATGCTDNTDCPSETECLEVGPGPQPRCVNPEFFGCLVTGCEDSLECVSYNSSDALQVTACQQHCQAASDCASDEVCGSIDLGETRRCFQKCGDEKLCSEGWICTSNVVHVEGEEVYACFRDVGSEARRLLATQPNESR